MTYSAFDHPFLSGLLGDEAVAAEFSVAADIRAMLSFEAALFDGAPGAYAPFIDAASFVDYHLFTEALKNADGSDVTPTMVPQDVETVADAPDLKCSSAVCVSGTVTSDLSLKIRLNE